MHILIRAALAALLLVTPAVAKKDPTARFTAPGKFGVGTTRIIFTKTSVTTGQPRVLDTFIWYPVDAAETSDTPLVDAEVRRGKFPLLVFSHGACGIPQQSLFLTQALASRGYIVAAPPHPGNQITDGFPQCFTGAVLADSFANRLPDVMFTIDSMLAESSTPTSRFYRHVDPKRIGVAGHSFGGQTTLRVAAADTRVRAALALAPALTAGIEPGSITVPTMIQGADHDSLANFEANSVPGYERLAGPRFLIEILNTGHFAFSDICAGSIFGTPDCQPQFLTQDQAHAAILRFAVPFLDRYLAGRPGSGRFLKPNSAPSGVTVVHSEAKPLP